MKKKVVSMLLAAAMTVSMAGFATVGASADEAAGEKIFR